MKKSEFVYKMYEFIMEKRGCRINDIGVMEHLLDRMLQHEMILIPATDESRKYKGFTVPGMWVREWDVE